MKWRAFWWGFCHPWPLYDWAGSKRRTGLFRLPVVKR